MIILKSDQIMGLAKAKKTIQNIDDIFAQQTMTSLDCRSVTCEYSRRL
jgi:hypothetical protein